MKTLWWLMGGMVLGAVATFLSYENHFVITDDGLVLVSKSPATLSDTFVDIRDWGFDDWADHAPLARALIQDGRAELLGQSAVNGLWEQLGIPAPATRTAEQPGETVIQ